MTGTRTVPASDHVEVPDQRRELEQALHGLARGHELQAGAKELLVLVGGKAHSQTGGVDELDPCESQRRSVELLEPQPRGVQAEAELAATPVTILDDPPAGYRHVAFATARAEGADIAVGDLLVFLDAGPVVDPGAGDAPLMSDGSAAVLRSVWEDLRARSEEPEVQLPEGARAHRQRRRCTGQTGWWEPAMSGDGAFGIDGAAMRTLRP